MGSNGTYEPSIGEWLSRLLTEERWGCKGKDVWDVGAYRGYVSLLCAKYGKGQVLSFEPFKKNLEQFHIHLNGNPDLATKIEIFPAAVSDADGQVRFLVGDADAEGQIVSPGVRPWNAVKKAEAIWVNTVRLDSLLEQGRPGPGLLKIDIEGAEALAFAGAARLLRDWHPVVLLEVHNEEAALASICLLRQGGYCVHRIKGNRLMPLPNEDISYGHVLAFDPRRSLSPGAEVRVLSRVVT